MSTKISIVLPMFNEEDVVEKVVAAVEQEIEQLAVEYEILCVNDGSTDGTSEILARIAVQNSKVVPVSLSRNFGKEAAMLAGLDSSRGDAVLILDSDLQHPPKLIPEMVELWRAGNDVVECKKVKRHREGLFYRLAAGAFNVAIGNSVNVDMRGASDFKLLDRQVVDVVRSLPERVRFFRGLVCWVGFKSIQLPFEVQERAGGTSTWSKLSIVNYAINNLFAFTTRPLYATAWIGFLTTVLGICLGVQTLSNFLMGVAVSGFTTVILLTIFFSGVTVSCVGVVAIYIAKVLEEVKMRPVYIVRRERDVP